MKLELILRGYGNNKDAIEVGLWLQKITQATMKVVYKENISVQTMSEWRPERHQQLRPDRSYYF